MKKLYIGWNDVDWIVVRSKIFKWQQNIFLASKIGDIETVRKYQNKIVQSLDAKLLSVKRLTQDNKSVSNLSIDKVIKLFPYQKLALAKSLTILNKKSSMRNLCISKIANSKKRLLHLLIIKDCCLQLLFKLALEPEWEARFEKNSYGFRPGRNCHDAVMAIKYLIYKFPKYLLVAHRVNSFSCVDHEKLLEKIGLFGKFRKQLKFWLINAVLEKKNFLESNPWPAIIFSLLANITLHGIEEFCKLILRYIPIYSSNGKLVRHFCCTQNIGFVRYADSFVVIHPNLSVITLLQNKLPEFLSEIGLEVTSSLIYISHSLEIKQSVKYICTRLGKKPGFNFLGFYIRQHRTFNMSVLMFGKEKLGFSTLVIPSKENRKVQQKKLHLLVLNVGKRISQDVLITKLNPLIWFWSKYFGKFGQSNINIIGFFRQMDYLLYIKLRQWASRVYKTIGKGKIVFRKIGTTKWIFATEKVMLLKHIDCLQARSGYVKVMNSANLYDLDQIYWIRRLSNNYKYVTDVTGFLTKQNFFCKLCGRHIYL